MVKTHTLKIPHKLIGLNDYIKVERSNKYKAAILKSRIETEIKSLCRKQLRGVRIENPVNISYVWVEENRRRDKDNIAFAKKFIQDALVGAKVLKNDGWAEIDGFDDYFKVDKNNPRVEVIIRELA